MTAVPTIVRKRQQPGDIRRIRGDVEDIFRPTSRTASGYFDLANSVFTDAQDGDTIILSDVVADSAGTQLSISDAVTIKGEGFTARQTASYNYAVRAFLPTAGDLVISDFRVDGNGGSVTLTGGNRGECFSALIYDGDLTLLGDCHFYGSAESDNSYNLFADCRNLNIPQGIRLTDPGRANVRFNCLTANVVGLHSKVSYDHSKNLRHAMTGVSNNYLYLEVDVAPGGAGWSVGNTLTGQTSSQQVTIKEKYSDTMYMVASTGTPAFTDSEIISNGTDAVDCGTGYPSITFPQIIRQSNITLESTLATAVNSVYDNSYPIREVSIRGASIREPARNTDRTNATFKVETATRAVFKDIEHDAPSLEHDTYFLNLAGVDTTEMESVHTPGTIYCPNTTTDVSIKHCWLGKNSTIDNVFTDRTAHRVEGDLWIENSKFTGLQDHALNTSTPNANQRIRGNNVLFEWNTSSNEFVMTTVPDTHNFAIANLRIDNIGSGAAYLSNSSQERMMMSNEGIPGRIRHGWKTYNDGGPVTLGNTTNGPNHPTAGSDSDAFSGVTAFEGDTADDDQGNKWTANASGQFVKVTF